MQISVQNLEIQISEYGQKDDELTKVRNELYTLRSNSSTLEDQIYSKEAHISRLIKELTYTKEQYNEIEEDLKIRQ